MTAIEFFSVARSREKNFFTTPAVDNARDCRPLHPHTPRRGSETGGN